MANQNFKQLLVDLLSINGPSKNERKIADAILHFCKRNQVLCKEDRSSKITGGNAGNILAWPKGVNPDKAPLMFACHMDTVDVGNERAMTVNRERISASGSYPIGMDNRLGVALLLRLLAEKKGHFVCAFTTQEEIGMFGAEALRLPKGVKAVYCLDGSGPAGHYVISTVGCLTFKIALLGRSSHAGIAPNGGVSTLQIAAKAISELPIGMPGHDESINIGVLNGGTRSNVVPGQAEVLGEVRANSIKKTEAVFAGILKVFGKYAKQYGGTLTHSREDMFKPYAQSKKSAIVKELEGAIIRAGLIPDGTHYRGGSDANVFNFRGCPSINLSIGALFPHSPQEYGDLKEAEKAYRILLELIG